MSGVCRECVARALAVLLILASGATAADDATPSESRPIVVLLHGLARSAASMSRMERALEDAGYRVCNIDYPSREHAIAELAERFVAPAIAQCTAGADVPVHFVTHSLGGIVARHLAHAGLVESVGRVVMLGPPNRGSEVVDVLGDWTLFSAINGPAGGELGTAADSVPLRLGPVRFEAGVIAGSRSINWINSHMIPGVDDGKVSVERAKLDGMRDFIVIPVSHPFLMKDREAIRQTIRFLRRGCFEHDAQEASEAGMRPCVPAAVVP